MKFTISKENCNRLNVESYEVNTLRQFEGYEPGDMVCYCSPFSDMPLTLEIAIRKDGSIVFRRWNWNKESNYYLHTSENPDEFEPTEAQRDTVNGLWSGRLDFEGIKLPVGLTVQKICPVDVTKEEEILNKKIYLA